MQFATLIKISSRTSQILVFNKNVANWQHFARQKVKERVAFLHNLKVLNRHVYNKIMHGYKTTCVNLIVIK